MNVRFAKPIDTYRIKSYLKEGDQDHYHQHDFVGVKDFNDEMFEGPYLCDKCGKEFNPSQGSQIYDTPSGEPEPGCLFWNTSIPENYYWDNHKGPHLMVVCPNGSRWCIDSRASNCDMPDDRTHRCWVWHGDPEKGEIHVDKNGHTCGAGGGSIWVDQGTSKEYHGMLQNSVFNP